MPACPNARIALYVMRRIGAHGLPDARAAHAMFTAFGKAFRRPLVLMRALMAEMAATSEGTVQIAPCCCPRLTPAEHAFLTILGRAETEPVVAALLLSDLLSHRRIEGVLASAAAVAAAFADGGRPVAV